MGELKKSSVFPGFFLILLGAILLIHKLVPDFLGWRQLYPLIILGLGIMYLFRASMKPRNSRGGVFPGTILLLAGIFFILRNYDLVPFYYVRDVWQVFVIIFGLGFLALYIANPKDWGVLIPAGIFIFIGVLSLLKMYFIIDWELWDILSDYWPTILILIGLAIIINSLRKENFKSVKSGN